MNHFVSLGKQINSKINMYFFFFLLYWTLKVNVICKSYLFKSSEPFLNGIINAIRQHAVTNSDAKLLYVRVTYYQIIFQLKYICAYETLLNNSNTFPVLQQLISSDIDVQFITEKLHCLITFLWGCRYKRIKVLSQCIYFPTGKETILFSSTCTYTDVLQLCSH